MGNFSKNSFSLVCANATEEGRICKLDANGDLVYSGATDDPATTPLVVTVSKSDASRMVPVVPLKGGHLVGVVSSGTIVAGNAVYLDSNGKVSATGTYKVGVAITNSSANEFSYFITV